MSGKKIGCWCTGLLCCAIAMASMQRAVADGRNNVGTTAESKADRVDVKGVELVKESRDVLDPENAKMWNYLVENFDSDSIDYAIQKLGNSDANAIFTFLTAATEIEDAVPHGGTSNDDCITAEPLALNTIVIVDNTVATDDAQSTLTCGTGALNQAVWYTVVGNGTTLTATTCNAGGSFNDTKIQVWCGTDCANLVCVGGNDDATCAISGLRSVFSWCSANGQTYWIAAGGFSTNAGIIALSVNSGAACATPVSCTPPTGRCCTNLGATCTVNTQAQCTTLGGVWTLGGNCTPNNCPIQPANDNCASATVITNGLTPYNTVNATTDGPTLTCTGFTNPVFKNVWYLYTATCNGTLTVDTCEQLGGSATYDSRLAIFNTATCTPLATDLLACNDDAAVLACGTSAGGFHSAVVGAPVVQGTTYLITVGAFGSTGGGPGVLHIECIAPGACCQAGGTCTNEADVTACNNLGGTFLGSGTTCAQSNCNTGSCCHANGTCTDGGLASACNAVNDVFSPGATCALAGCSGRCCFLNGLTESCQNTNLPGCDALGGVFTANLTCANDPCPLGKCCNDQGAGPQCNNYTQQHCDALGGTFTVGVTCQPGDCLPAANDNCDTAIELGCGDSANGTTDGATNDYTFAAGNPVCSTFTTAGDDVVYSFTTPVTRDVVVTMQPATADLDIFVVTDCNDLSTCLDASQAGGTGLETITWTANANTTYFIIIDEFSAATLIDTFVINVSCPIGACESCPGDMDGNGRLNGRDVQAFTDCLTGSVGGIPPEGCGCADTNDDESVTTADVASFAAILTSVSNKFCGDGEGRCCQDGGNSCTDHLTLYECNDLGGTFTAGLTCATPCPLLADDCDDAPIVGVPSSTVGDNLLATDDLFPAPCLIGAPNQGVWYDVVGTGNTMTITTCNAATTFDTMLEVFCGPCENPVCIAGNDDSTCSFSGLRSTISWCSAIGETYHIRVSGFGGNVGTFQLDVSDDGSACGTAASCVPPPIPDNDVCESAIVANCDDFISGTIAGAFNQYNPTFAGCTGYDAAGPDVVYSITVPSDQIITLNYNPTGTPFDAAIYVVTDCADVLGSCVAGADDNFVAGPEVLDFGASANVTYFIICDQFGAVSPVGAGAFDLAVTCTPAIPGACCSPSGNCQVVIGGVLCPEGSTFSESMTCEEVICESCANCEDSEFEGNCGNLTDTVNGGCNSTPPVFTPITCGVPVCGTAWAQAGRDTDWWSLNLTTAAIVNWSATADFDFQMVILDATDCLNVLILSDFLASTACNPLSVSATLPPGDYVMFISPSVFDGFTCASGPWNYTAEVTCTEIANNGACCVDQVCTDGVSPEDCETQGGFYAGLGTDCGSITCPGPNDECDGAIAINCDDTISGTTAGAVNNYNPTFAGCTGYDAAGPDIVYSINLASDTLVTLTMVANGFDASLYVLTDCGNTGSCVAGADETFPTGTEQLSFVALAHTTYFVICDQFNAVTPGPFDLTMTCSNDLSGACCNGEDCTQEADQATCEGLGGTWQGVASNCGSVVCGAAASCCIAHATPGCTTPECQALICGQDAFCCTTAWDQLCTNAAIAQCGICGGGGGSNCCIANGGLGCDTQECQDIVCGLDAFCCDTQWDGLCADAALANCAVCAP